MPSLSLPGPISCNEKKSGRDQAISQDVRGLLRVQHTRAYQRLADAEHLYLLRVLATTSWAADYLTMSFPSSKTMVAAHAKFGSAS